MSQDKFYQWVMEKFRNDPYIMMNYYSTQIADEAAKVSIDWLKSCDNVDLNGKVVKGSRVTGMCEADKSRISVIGYNNTETTKFGNVVHYPTIRFNNFRKQFSEPVYFAGYKALWGDFMEHSEFDADTTNYDKGALERRKRQIREEEERLQKLEDEAVQRDWNWLTKMARRDVPCPYLSSKGLHDAHQLFELYTGRTSKGVCTGEFTAVRAIDLCKGGAFGGLQRLYRDGKVFRTGLSTQGKAWFSAVPKDGEDIYLTEAVAEAAMAAKLTELCACAAFYADNIAMVAQLLRAMFPRSKILFIADNDQYSHPNKGVESCVHAINLINDNFYLYVPDFKSKEKAKKKKDFTDYCLAYGLEAGRQLITKHLRAA